MTNVNQNFYHSHEIRTTDEQYTYLLNEVLKNGHFKTSIQGPRALTLLGPRPMRFQLNNGIPLITERNLHLKPKNKPLLWEQAIAEIIAFINGARTLKEIESYGCFWWDKWATKERCELYNLEAGDFGPGFYGEAFTRFPTQEGGTFNQIAEVIEQIKTLPQYRTHFVSPWIPQHLIGKHRRATITPCLGWMLFEVYDGKINLCLMQRAGDVPIGIPFNTFQYATLLLMVAQVTNLTPNEFVHMIMDAHIYENQLPAVEQMISRKARKFPILKVNPSVTDLVNFRIKDYSLEEYNPHPKIDIPVSI